MLVCSHMRLVSGARLKRARLRKDSELTRCMLGGEQEMAEIVGSFIYESLIVYWICKMADSIAVLIYRHNNVIIRKPIKYHSGRNWLDSCPDSDVDLALQSN